MIQPRPKTELERDRSVAVSVGLTIDTPPWMLEAACRDTTEPDQFFPDESNQKNPVLEICSRCLVRAECLYYALENREQHGVWGGVSAHGRRAILRRRKGIAA